MRLPSNTEAYGELDVGGTIKLLLPAGTGNADNTGIVLAGGSTGNTTTFLGQISTEHEAAPTVTIYDLATPRATGNVHRHTYGSAGSNGNTAVVTDINQHSFIVRSDSGISASGIIFTTKSSTEL